MHLETLEPRLLLAGIAAPQVEMVYLSPQPSLDAALGFLAAPHGGQVAASVTLPTWEGAWGVDPALKLGLLLGQIPYQGTSTVVVAVVPGSFVPYHELLSLAGGQVPVLVAPGDSPGHPEFPGLSYDFAAIVNGYYTSDPPAPYYAAPEPVPGIGTVTVDYVTGAPPPGPFGPLPAPNLQAADLLFFWLGL